MTPAAARALQEELATQVIMHDAPGVVRHVAGVDVHFPGDGREARASVVVVHWPGLEPVAWAVAMVPVDFPYIPGLLSFRELPAARAALERLPFAPDLVLCDGQGYAHPRRFGLACHLGVVTGLPAIGVAKSRLIGTHEEPPVARGGHVPLRDRGETIGEVVRTRSGVRPLYVSVGHRVALATAVEWVLRLAVRFRLPEPARLAHRLASGSSIAGCRP